MELSNRDLLLIIINKLGIEDPLQYFENMSNKEDYCKHHRSYSSSFNDEGWECNICGKWIKR